MSGLDMSCADFLIHIQCPYFVTGYILHTMPFSIYLIMREDGLQEAFRKIVQASGDTDTIGATVGSALGLLQDNLPELKLFDYPRNANLLDSLAKNLQTGKREKIPYFACLSFPRNILATVIIFIHGVRRLLPFY